MDGRTFILKFTFKIKLNKKIFFNKLGIKNIIILLKNEQKL